jgi:acetyltransferase-like isoleucine patch superfamily enzyme
LEQDRQKADPSLEPVDVQGEDLDVEIAASARIDGPVRVRGKRNRLAVGSDVRFSVFGPASLSASEHGPGAGGIPGLVLEGEDNVVEIAEGARLGVNLNVHGSGNRVTIERNCQLRGVINLLGSNASLHIGEGTTMVHGALQLHEAGEVRIGADCMISSQVYISLSDIHPIYDRASGRRINPAASVSIGDHVWLGLRCMVLKGAHIGDGAVVAAGATVSGQVPSHAIVAGAPAKLLRENIEWRRDFSQAGPEPTGSVTTPAGRRFWEIFKKR